MKRVMFFLFLPMILGACSLYAQGMSFHGKIRNSIYSYESDQAHTRIYQYAQFSALNADQTIALQGAVRALTDANTSLDSDQRFKAYSLNLAVKNLAGERLDLTFGRQFLHPGTVLGALDGLNAQYRLSRKLQLQLYGGWESVYKRNLDVGENNVLGGMVTFRRKPACSLQGFVLNKANDGESVWQLAGLNIDNSILPKTRFQGQFHYDAKNSRLHRLLLGTRNKWSDRWMTTIEYKLQHPQIYANSYFTIFELETYKQVKLGAAYSCPRGFTVDMQYRNLKMESESANQAMLSVSTGNGSLGFIYESGYAGDQIGVLFDYALELLPHLVASVYMDYSKYRAETIYEYDNQLANAARLSYRVGRNWAVDVEYQWLRNRFQKSDSRLLNHISFRW